MAEIVILAKIAYNAIMKLNKLTSYPLIAQEGPRGDKVWLGKEKESKINKCFCSQH